MARSLARRVSAEDPYAGEDFELLHDDRSVVVTADDGVPLAVRECGPANAPLTVRAAKLTIDALVRHPEHPDTSALDAAVDACFDSADYAEGRRAFLEKRKPRFEGR